MGGHLQKYIGMETTRDPHPNPGEAPKREVEGSGFRGVGLGFRVSFGRWVGLEAGRGLNLEFA